MKKFSTLTIITCIFASSCFAQGLPPGSIELIPHELYGNKNKQAGPDVTKPANKTTSSCGTTCDWPDVLGNGNSTSIEAIEDDGTRKTVFHPSGVSSYKGTAFLAAAGNLADTGALMLADPGSPYVAIIHAGPLTGYRWIDMPNEHGVLVTHVTKDPITIVNGGNSGYISYANLGLIDGTGHSSEMTSTKVSEYDAGGNEMSLKLATGEGQLLYYNGSSGYTNILNNVTLTNDHAQSLPDEDGTLVTHTTKDAINVTNGSFGTTQVLQGAIQMQDATTGKIAKITTYTGVPYISLQDSGSSNYISVRTAQLTNTQVQYLPNDAGEIMINHGDNNSITITLATSVTITYATAISFTPSNVIPVPKNIGAGTAISGGYYVSNITSTSYKINFLGPAFTGLVSFGCIIQK